ncbi:MAG: Crp/Fnr family transcriptional regulator [Hyphomonas sp.]|nr:Crp/Fnr family transcriptional regulator [Hyphomonas sp.]
MDDRSLIMDAFRNRLSQYVSLKEQSWESFAQLQLQARIFQAGDDLVREGQRLEKVFIVKDGWAIRYRTLDDGRRQIVNFMLPGDVFDMQVVAGVAADHTVTALTRTVVMTTSATCFLDVLRNDSDVAAAFWWAAVQEESILREQIVRVGRRSARERISHLLLELQRRLRAATGGSENHLALPLTRSDLADALGLTPVHVSRTMSGLRQAGLIAESRGQVAILDKLSLARLAQFDADYLHIRRLDFASPTLLADEA